MTREEIKEELLNNDTEQKFIIQNAQFISLVTILIRKGIITKQDHNDLVELVDKNINLFNEKVLDNVMEVINKEK